MKLHFTVVATCLFLMHFTYCATAELDCPESSPCFKGRKLLDTNSVYLVSGIPATIRWNPTALLASPPLHSMACGNVTCPQDTTCCGESCCGEGGYLCCSDSKYCCKPGYKCCGDSSWCCPDNDTCATDYGKCKHEGGGGSAHISSVASVQNIFLTLLLTVLMF